MQKSRTLFLGMLSIVLVFGCNKSQNQDTESKSHADSTYNILSSTAAIQNKKDTTRKFLRTADIKFKVNNVVRSTYDIEEITKRHGGFVTLTNLSTNIQNIETTIITKDSSFKTTYYTVTNSLNLRIPNINLDTTLKEISKNVAFLDHRVITADDVSLNLLSNSLSQARSANSQKRLINAIDDRGKKLYETNIALADLENKIEAYDNASLSARLTNDKINFSTIILDIYQPKTTHSELIANDIKLDSYEPRFAQKIVLGLIAGWKVLENLILFIINIWSIILISGIGYYLYKTIKQKKNLSIAN